MGAKNSVLGSALASWGKVLAPSVTSQRDSLKSCAFLVPTFQLLHFSKSFLIKATVEPTPGLGLCHQPEGRAVPVVTSQRANLKNCAL